MQCKGYFPGLVQDVNENASSSNCRLYNVQNVSENGLGNNGITQQSPVLEREMVYSEEEVKRTILEQEAIFRDQVKELHHLHKIQADIMDEFNKKHLHENPIEINTSNSDSDMIPPRLNYDNDKGKQIVLENGSSNDKGKGNQIIIENGGDFEDSKILRSKVMFGNKILDLQLPASEYVDSDEEGLDDHVGPTEVFLETDTTLLDPNGGSINVENASSKFTCLFDLNEPLELDEAENEADPISKNNDFPCRDSNSFEPTEDHEHQMPLFLDTEKSSDESKNVGSEIDQIVPYSANSEPSEKSTQDLKRNPIAVQALPCFKSPNGITREKIKLIKKSASYVLSSNGIFLEKKPEKISKDPSGPGWNLNEVEDSYTNEEFGVLDMNSVSIPSPKSRKRVMDNTMIVKNLHDQEISRIADDQLNKGNFSSRLFIDADKKITENLDLEAPISPENEECLPPRKELNKNETEQDLMKIAAEAIVSISSTKVQICPSSDEPLHWFAGVISSIEGSLENNDENPDFDYFEFMTLNLKETKIEDYPLFNVNQQKDEKTDVTLLASGQRRSGRSRRGTRQLNNFQREVLPSLTSLTRYEVAEDIHLIDGMLEASGTFRKTHGNRRKRSEEGQNCQKGIEESCLVGWGKIARRRRGQGQRRPNTNLPIILSKV